MLLGGRLLGWWRLIVEVAPIKLRLLRELLLFRFILGSFLLIAATTIASLLLLFVVCLLSLSLGCLGLLIFVHIYIILGCKNLNNMAKCQLIEDKPAKRMIEDNY